MEDVAITPGLALADELPERAPVFAEATKPTGEIFNDDELWPNRGKFQCIRTSREKYMFRLPDEQFRMYDLAADRTERDDLAAAHPEVVERLSAQWERWSESVRPAADGSAP